MQHYGATLYTATQKRHCKRQAEQPIRLLRPHNRKLPYACHPNRELLFDICFADGMILDRNQPISVLTRIFDMLKMVLIRLQIAGILGHLGITDTPP